MAEAELGLADLVDANTYEETDEITPDEPLEETVDETEELEDDAEQDETDGKSEESDEQDETKEESETAPIEDLDTLAQAMEKPLDEVLDTVKGKVTINGQVQEVTLGEALKGYQRQVDYQKNTEQLKGERSTFEQQRDQVSAIYVQKLQDSDRILDQVREALIGELNTPEVQALQASNRPEDRLRYMELSQAHTQRVQQFQNFYDQHKTQIQQEQQQLNGMRQQQYQAMVQDQTQKLQQQWPEYGPTKQAELTEFLFQEYGLSQQELGGITDHRMYLIARDAMLAKQVKTEADTAAKKVAKLPGLTQKPKRSLSAKQKQALKGGRAAKRAKETGSVNDAARWLDESGIDF